MRGLLLSICIIVLGVIIVALIIFFKNRKENNEFYNFSWEKEKRKEKELFERENNYQTRDSKYKQYDKSSLENEINLENRLSDDKKYQNDLYNESQIIDNGENNRENTDDINLIKNRLKYKINRNQPEKLKKLK